MINFPTPEEREKLTTFEFEPGKTYEFAPRTTKGRPKINHNEQYSLIYQEYKSGKHIFKYPGTTCTTSRTNAQLVTFCIREL